MLPTRIRAAAIAAGGAIILAGCSSGGASPSLATPTATLGASPSATVEPTPNLGHAVILTAGCDNPPHVRPLVAVSEDGSVVLALGEWVVRKLSPAGLGQLRREVLDAPLLQVSAEYPLERLPQASGVVAVPVHAICTYTFTIGTGPDAVVVRSVRWNGDEEEAQFYVPSPQRRELDRLAGRLMGVGDWVTADGWSGEAWLPYSSASYLLWVDPQVGPAPDGIPSVTGATWPFASAIDSFGDPIGPGRCGYLNPAQATETVQLIRDAGVEAGLQAATAVTALRTDAGWVRILLTPRAPKGFPTCADEAPFQW